MRNELLLLLSFVLCYGGVLVFFRLFRKEGLFGWIVLATIAANIEVLLLIRAFGMEQTLGNVLFASTFLVTDLLGECYGKKAAGRAVAMGVAANLIFIAISQTWLLFTPAEGDWAMPHISEIFRATPRVMLASLFAYVVSESFDVWAYHAIWERTTRRFGSARRALWLRNNGSTLLSQFVNTALFTVGAFAGTFDAATVLSIGISSYAIYIVTSLLDTPFMYIGRALHERAK